MKAQERLLLFLVTLSCATAEYIVMVKVHNYDNPTNRCPTCRHTVAFRQGCCDNFDNTDSCVGQDRCDNSFFYCLKALDSRPDSDPRDTSRCGFHSSEGTISHRNEDGAPIDFTRSTPLGIPNPFQLAGITAKWKGVQLYVEVEDIDGQDPSSNSVVDTFSINITTPIGTFTKPTWYNGTFGYATIQLSYKVECTISHYSNCDSTCAETRNCSCIPGYGGETCERNIDECLNASCQANSVCMDAINAYTCECLPGFSGESCTREHIGTTDVGLLTTTELPPLVCSPGFTGPTCEVDIGECLGTTCSGNGECMDGTDGYTCNCRLEYTGANCEIRTDHCVRVVCATHGKCVDGKTCTCEPGFTGIHCEVRMDDCYRATCSGRGTCVDRGNFYTCTCDPGYLGGDCEIDINECARVMCSGHGRCQDEVEQFYCECEADYTGLLCETRIDDCLLANCSTTEQCVDDVKGFHCTCRPGYTGELCETQLPMQGCADMDCNGNGVCNATIFNCDCFTGYSGEFCQQFNSTDFTTANLTVTSDTLPSYTLPVGMTIGVAFILGLVIAGAIILTKVCITKHEHTYEDVTSGTIKTPNSLSKISTYVNESYNFTGHVQPPTTTQLATPSPPLQGGTSTHPIPSELRHMSLPSKHYENHTTIRAHRLNTVSGMNTAIKTPRNQSKAMPQSHSSPSKAKDKVYENSMMIREHRVNMVSGRGIATSSFSRTTYTTGQHRRTQTLRGSETLYTPPSFPSPHTEDNTPQQEPYYINGLNNYSFLSPDNDLDASDTYCTDCHPYLDYQPRHLDNDHQGNTENHFYDVDSQIDAQEGYHHYDMDSQLSDSDNHTYEMIPEVPEPSL